MDALEILDFCYYDGKIDMGSAFETKLLCDMVYQLNMTKDWLSTYRGVQLKQFQNAQRS